jgi:hypothetical protein
VRIDTQPQDDWIVGHRKGEPPARSTDQPDAGGWLGFAQPDDGGKPLWTNGVSIVGAGRMGVMTLKGGDSSWLISNTKRADIQDCIIVARVEFPEHSSPTSRSAVGLLSRVQSGAAYSGLVGPHGNASIVIRGLRYAAGTRMLAMGELGRPPGRFLYLVATVQGSRYELYCNGELAVVTDEVAETPGRVGIEVRDATIIVHDLKYRLLPTDPRYKEVYQPPAAPAP